MTERDFYIMELGSAGIMRGYMVHPCSEDFPLEKKLDAFLRLSLSGYGVPAEEIEHVVQIIRSLDMRTIAQDVMQELFHALEMHYDFSLDPSEA